MINRGVGGGSGTTVEGAMEMRRGNITAGAVVGTGAATLSLALFGLAGLGGDLRAADAVRTTPQITTEELRETLRQERRSHKWDGSSPLPSNSGSSGEPSVQPSPPLTAPTTPTPQAEKEL